MSDVREWLAETDEGMLLVGSSNGEYDEAIIGWMERFGEEPIAVYDVEKLIEILMNDDDMTEEDAWEHYYYNIVGSGIDRAPGFVYLYK